MTQVSIVHVSDRDPWERQQRESTKAYAYFCTYRDLGPVERSYRRTAEVMGKSLAYLTKLAIAKEWTSRVEAWDAMQESRKRIVQQQAIDEMNDRQARIAMTMLTKVAQRLVGDEANAVVAIDPSTLSARDLATLAAVASKMERLARGAEVDEEHGDAVKIRVAFEINPVFPGAPAAQGIEPTQVEPGDIVEAEYEEVAK